MEMTCKWLDLDPEMKEIPYDLRTKNLIDGLTEDPEDNPDRFIPIIELHNARLKKAPVVSGTALAAFGVSNMTEEELMHYEWITV